MANASKKKTYVQVWAGRFDTAERRIAYFHETYDDGDGDEEPPISEFAAGQDESFYDHDELEINFRTEIEPEFRSLLEPCSFSSSYVDAVLAAYEAGAEPVNLLILYFGEELSEPRSVSGPEFALHYLGRFVYDEEADSVSTGQADQ